MTVSHPNRRQWIRFILIKDILEAHGGRIWAENNANGKGATF
jgi:signal transduction histidine kinase